MSSRAARLLDQAHADEAGRELSERIRLTLRLGQMVYEMRTHAGFSQEELAERIRTKQSALSRLEGGNAGHIPSYELLERIARACGYHLSMSAEAVSLPAVAGEGHSDITVPLT